MAKIIIRTPVPAVNGRHWELDFIGGVAETDSEEIALKYEKRGYSVERMEADTEPVKKPAAKKPRTRKE